MKFDRRTRIGILSSLLIGLLAVVGYQQRCEITSCRWTYDGPQVTQGPNVLFIAVDDLRPFLGAYGHEVAQTPNIDAFAQSGTLFENAFVSIAICAPSRAALMTGLRPETTGIYRLDQPVDEAAPGVGTIGEAFHGAGYTTARIGKIYHHPADRDFAWDYSLDSRNAVPTSGDLVEVFEDENVLNDRMNLEKAKGLLRKMDGPFFMAVGFRKPHLSFMVPKQDWDAYEGIAIPPSINPTGQRGAPPWALRQMEIHRYNNVDERQPFLAPDQAEEARRGYLAATTWIDRLIGELLDELERQGLAENTIVVLWGDHGFKLGDHGYWAKHSNVDLDIRIPLIVRAPGVTPAGSRADGIVETVDIFPTLAELTGVGMPEELDGASFVSLLRRPSGEGKMAAFAQYPRYAGQTDGHGPLMGDTVRTRDYRYTAWIDEDGSIVARELYDLRKDSVEATNLAGQRAYADAEMRLEKIRRSR